MSVSMIDGTLEAAVLKSSRGKVRVFDRLTFRLRDGSTTELRKAVVDAAVAPALVPGTAGRFYAHKVIDHKGVHGFRDGKGGALFGYGTVNETFLLVITALNAFLVAIGILYMDRIYGLSLLFTLLGVPLYFAYRSGRLRARAQFERDSAFGAFA